MDRISTLERGKFIEKIDLLTGKRLMVDWNKGHDMVPVYASDWPEYSKVLNMLKSYGIKTGAWKEESEPTPGSGYYEKRRELLVVDGFDVKQAEGVLTDVLNLKLFPPYFRRIHEVI